MRPCCVCRMAVGAWSVGYDRSVTGCGRKAKAKRSACYRREPAARVLQPTAKIQHLHPLVKSFWVNYLTFFCSCLIRPRRQKLQITRLQGCVGCNAVRCNRPIEAVGCSPLRGCEKLQITRLQGCVPCNAVRCNQPIRSDPFWQVAHA